MLSLRAVSVSIQVWGRGVSHRSLARGLMHSCCSCGVRHADLRHLNSDRVWAFLPLLIGPGRELIALELPRLTNSSRAYHYLVVYVDSLGLVVHVDDCRLHGFPFLFRSGNLYDVLSVMARRRRLVSEQIFTSLPQPRRILRIFYRSFISARGVWTLRWDGREHI